MSDNDPHIYESIADGICDGISKDGEKDRLEHYNSVGVKKFPIHPTLLPAKLQAQLQTPDYNRQSVSIRVNHSKKTQWSNKKPPSQKNFILECQAYHPDTKLTTHVGYMDKVFPNRRSAAKYYNNYNQLFSIFINY